MCDKLLNVNFIRFLFHNHLLCRLNKKVGCLSVMALRTTHNIMYVHQALLDLYCIMCLLLQFSTS
jgi:hypothetical protein